MARLFQNVDAQKKEREGDWLIDWLIDWLTDWLIDWHDIFPESVWAKGSSNSGGL